MRLYVWEPENAAFLIHECPLEARMPYLDHLRFSVSDFVRLNNTDVCWTDRRALTALDGLCRRTGVPFLLDCGFRRPGAAGINPLSPHCAGLAFALGKDLPKGERELLRACALGTGAFHRVGMPYESGLSLHLTLLPFPARLEAGDGGAAVLALQDRLLFAGLYRGALTGVYGEETRRAVLRLQRRMGLPETGRMEAACWQALRRIDKPTPECDNNP